jgi:hypothetical protein
MGNDMRSLVFSNELTGAETVGPLDATFDISDRSCDASCEAAVEGYEARYCPTGLRELEKVGSFEALGVERGPPGLV